MNSKTNRWIRLMILATVISTGMQFEGCITGAANYVSNYNPCGTVLNCNASDYALASSGYTGPGADPVVDPWCTYPPYCTASVDPLHGHY